MIKVFQGAVSGFAGLAAFHATGALDTNALLAIISTLAVSFFILGALLLASCAKLKVAVVNGKPIRRMEPGHLPIQEMVFAAVVCLACSLLSCFCLVMWESFIWPCVAIGSAFAAYALAHVALAGGMLHKALLRL